MLESYRDVADREREIEIEKQHTKTVTKLPPLREKQNNTPRFPHKALKHISEERKKSLRIW